MKHVQITVEVPDSLVMTTLNTSVIIGRGLSAYNCPVRKMVTSVLMADGLQPKPHENVTDRLDKIDAVLTDVLRQLRGVRSTEIEQTASMAAKVEELVDRFDRADRRVEVIRLAHCDNDDNIVKLAERVTNLAHRVTAIHESLIGRIGKMQEDHALDVQNASNRMDELSAMIRTIVRERPHPATVGETCYCGVPAVEKVCQDTFNQPIHGKTAYLCREHFEMVMGRTVTSADRG